MAAALLSGSTLTVGPGSPATVTSCFPVEIDRLTGWRTVLPAVTDTVFEKGVKPGTVTCTVYWPAGSAEME